MRLRIAATIALVALPLAAGADSSAKTFTVSYPRDKGPAALPTFARVLGMPTNGSCERLATKLGLDSDSLFVANNRDGDSLCILDDVTTRP